MLGWPEEQTDFTWNKRNGKLDLIGRCYLDYSNAVSVLKAFDLDTENK